MDTQPGIPQVGTSFTPQPKRHRVSLVVGVIFLCISGVLLALALYFIAQTLALLASPEMQDPTSVVGLALVMTVLLGSLFVAAALIFGYTGLLLVPPIRSPRKTVFTSETMVLKYRQNVLLLAVAWLGLAVASVVLFGVRIGLTQTLMMPLIYAVSVGFGVGGGIKYLVYYFGAMSSDIAIQNGEVLPANK